jgi:hypothetical protein
VGVRGWRLEEDGGVTHAQAPGGETPVTSPVPPARAGLIDFTQERQRHRRFVGRDDVLAQLDQWLLGPGEAGWVVVTGGPGMGKSAILSAWLARREAAGAVVAHHFVRRQVASWDQPEVIAASLAAQIEAMFPELRDPEVKPEGRLIELLGRVSKRLAPMGDLVVLVDGIGETRAEPGDNPLPRFLPHEVPDGIRLLCAMRPTYPHLHWIEARSPARRIDLDDRRWAASNEAVVRGFWGAVAAEYAPPLPAETIAAAIDRADGNVLYAVMLHDALRGLPGAERRVDRIPRGLKGLIGEIWDRAASHKTVRVGLGVLCAAQEALSLDVIADLAAWGPTTTRSESASCARRGSCCSRSRRRGPGPSRIARVTTGCASSWPSGSAGRPSMPITRGWRASWQPGRLPWMRRRGGTRCATRWSTGWKRASGWMLGASPPR